MPALKEITVREQVRGHERAIGVTAHAHAVRVADAAIEQEIHRGLRTGDQLLDIAVVGLFAVPGRRGRRTPE